MRPAVLFYNPRAPYVPLDTLPWYPSNRLDVTQYVGRRQRVQAVTKYGKQRDFSPKAGETAWHAPPNYADCHIE